MTVICVTYSIHLSFSLSIYLTICISYDSSTASVISRFDIKLAYHYILRITYKATWNIFMFLSLCSSFNISSDSTINIYIYLFHMPIDMNLGYSIELIIFLFYSDCRLIKYKIKIMKNQFSKLERFFVGILVIDKKMSI